MLSVIDCTNSPSVTSLRQAGVTGVVRYLCYSPVGDWKRIGQTEYNRLLGGGIEVGLVWELGALDWNGTNGASHGSTAVSQAQALGYPVGKVIYGAADFNMSRAQWNSRGLQYARDFASAVRSAGFKVGVYGPYDVLTWVRDEVGYDTYWQAGMSTAWSGGRNKNVWSGAHLRQRSYATIGGRDVDMNDALQEDWNGDTMALTDEERSILKDVARRVGNIDEYTRTTLTNASTTGKIYGGAGDDWMTTNQLAQELAILRATLAAAGGNPTIVPIMAELAELKATVTRLTEDITDIVAALKAGAAATHDAL